MPVVPVELYQARNECVHAAPLPAPARWCSTGPSARARRSVEGHGGQLSARRTQKNTRVVRGGEVCDPVGSPRRRKMAVETRTAVRSNAAQDRRARLALGGRRGLRPRPGAQSHSHGPECRYRRDDCSRVRRSRLGSYTRTLG